MTHWFHLATQIKLAHGNESNPRSESLQRMHMNSTICTNEHQPRTDADHRLKTTTTNDGTNDERRTKERTTNEGTTKERTTNEATNDEQNERTNKEKRRRRRVCPCPSQFHFSHYCTLRLTLKYYPRSVVSSDSVKQTSTIQYYKLNYQPGDN